jgi:hypothetical protein
MEENNMISKNRRNLLIAARILYIVMAILMLRRVWYFFMVNIRYFDEAFWTIIIDAAFIVLFLVLLILQFAHVFLNKPGRIRTGKIILILSAIFAAYGVFGWTQLIITFINIKLPFSEIDQHIIFNILLSCLIWSVYICYSIVINVLSRAKGKLR